MCRNDTTKREGGGPPYRNIRMSFKKQQQQRMKDILYFRKFFRSGSKHM